MAPKKRKSTSEVRNAKEPKGPLGEGQAIRDKLQKWLLD